MRLIRLSEYQHLPPKKGIALSAADQETVKELEKIDLVESDQKLKQDLEEKGILTITSDPIKKGLQVSAKSYIGVAQFTNFTVAIFPKFSTIDKLVELIDYVYDLDLDILPESEIEFQGEENLLSEIIISSFVKKCETLVRQGMVKSYISHQESVPYLRGKILLSQQICNDARKKVQFYCEHDELEYNNLENQIILYCLERSYDTSVNDSRKKEIRQIIHNFSDLVDRVKITEDDFRKISYNQMNQHYRKVHELCKLIVNSIHITNFYEKKTRFVNSFFVDMNKVFEKFVFKIFREHYDLPVKEQQTYASWRTDEGKTIQSIPDILVYDKQRKSITSIIDTKYKDELSQGDLYQIEHYVRDFGKNEGYAVLPEYLGSKPSTFQLMRQNLVINVRFINIDKILGLIFSKDEKDKRIKILEELKKLL